MQKHYMTDTVRALLKHIDADVLSTKASQGTTFSGIMIKCSVSSKTYGYLFGHKTIEQGGFICTSEVVNCGYCPEINAYYIETESRSRYIIADVEYNPHLSVSTASVKAAMDNKQHHIDINEQYYSSLKWS